MHNHNGTKANAALKWTWTLANNKHVINTTKKLETADLGGAKAFVKTEIDMTHESGKDQTFDVKGNLVLSGDEWKAPEGQQARGSRHLRLLHRGKLLGHRGRRVPPGCTQQDRPRCVMEQQGLVALRPGHRTPRR